MFYKFNNQLFYLSSKSLILEFQYFSCGFILKFQYSFFDSILNCKLSISCLISDSVLLEILDCKFFYF